MLCFDHSVRVPFNGSTEKVDAKTYLARKVTCKDQECFAMASQTRIVTTFCEKKAGWGTNTDLFETLWLSGRRDKQVLTIELFLVANVATPRMVRSLSVKFQYAGPVPFGRVSFANV